MLMLHFLGFLLIIILAVVLMGVGILLSVLRGVFRLRKGGGQQPRQRATAATVSDDGTVTVEEGELHINRKKIFGKDEGEYVSYEEVKD